MFFIGFTTIITAHASTKSTVGDLVKKHCKGIDYHIVMGQIQTESSFRNIANKNEPNGIPSVGLMQVQWPTAKWMKCGFKSEQGLYDPEGNIYCGCKYLRWQLKRYKGDYHAALAAYNAGTAFTCRISKNCKQGSFVNQSYVDKVIKNSKQFMEKKL